MIAEPRRRRVSTRAKDNTPVSSRSCNCYRNRYRRMENRCMRDDRRARLLHHRRSRARLMAEDGGFEPPRACTQHAFQACAIGH